MGARLVALLAAAVASPGCVTAGGGLAAVSPGDPGRLAAAAEAFYRAETPAQLAAAVAEAQAAGPDSAVFHELAAELAHLRGDGDAVVAHLVAALRDTADDAPLLHLHRLGALDLTWAQRDVVRPLLVALAAAHPDAQVRALASDRLAATLHDEGDLASRDALVAGVPGRVALAWAGTWDNDQGKSFDLELPVERRPGLDERYEGRLGPIAWRRDVPADPRGRYELSQVMVPSRWATAYGQGVLLAPRAGRYALHLTTTDPVKVWVDGALVFSAAQLERSVTDQLALPVELSAGRHRVLVKSAHRDGAWRLALRLSPWAGEASSRDVDGALAGRVPRAVVRAMPLRALVHRVAWAHLAVGGAATVRLADALSAQRPRGLVPRVLQVEALWFNQERGRAADLLAALDAEVGGALHHVRLRQLRFLFQQGLKLKARERLVALRREAPTREGLELLADHFRGEGWTVDEVAVLRERQQRFGASPDDAVELARALARLGRRDEAAALLGEVLAELPHHPEALQRRLEQALGEEDLPAARAALRARLSSWPVDAPAFVSLGEVHRRLGDRPAAERALGQARALAPDWATPVQRQGELAWEAGEAARAVALWRRAVELNPENEALAARVDFLSPEARGPWLADVPDEAELERRWRARGAAAQVPGADVAFLLDHEVTLLNHDGSTSTVVSLVAHAWNAQGRDRIIRQPVGAGRLRVLHAFSVDAQGQRAEASSERDRSIRFRGLQPGATLVLQYRLDAPPRGYLARHWTTSWSFQGAADQRAEATLVLWSPPGVTLHEATVGALSRTRERRGELVRSTWSAKDSPPLVAEPSMPTAGELATNLSLSTVPDWETWLSWERALLEGVFRDSPGLEAVARQLGRGEPDAAERLARIHTFVMEDIRYQQDYESFIAGVRPHAAPVTLERRYGDCKDKAVLFIQLARALGLEAHFALVRTRDAGPVRREVPMQQFNHAIVYVPAQQGVAARFFDPTAELLDVDTVRRDDVGTQALVFDPGTGHHAWREVPFQAPEANRETVSLALELTGQGAASGTLTIEGVGQAGSLVRRTARNPVVLGQLGQRLAAAHLPNATASDVRALEVESLRVPAAVRLDVRSPGAARAEGDTLRLKLPGGDSPRRLFSLAERRHPLLLGAPQLDEVRVELQVPDGWAVARAPRSGRVALPCLSLGREVSVEGRTVRSVQSWRSTCERLSPGDYAAARAKLDDFLSLLDDELVLAPTGKAAPAEGKPRAPRR